MCKKTLDQCKTDRDFVGHAEHHGGYVDHQTGSHMIVKGPSGGICPVPVRHGEYPTGTRRSIKKMFIAIGLALFMFLCAFYPAIVEAAHRLP
jgi:predicted RNA binding protein YcfA (HicA-like mRNA interferase family)